MKLDYSVKDAQGRLDLVRARVEAEGGSLTQADLTYMADYLLSVGEGGATKAEKAQEYPVVTRNREVTVSKRQVSYDELSEDDGSGWLELARPGDRWRVMDPKRDLSGEDVDAVPGLREKVECAESLKRQVASAHGRRRYELKQQLIETYREQHALRLSAAGGSRMKAVRLQDDPPCFPDEDVEVGEDGVPRPKPGCASLMDPKCVAALLSQYASLRYGDPGASPMDADVRLVALDLERLLKSALLPRDALLYDVAVMKMCGCRNEEVAEVVRRKYGVSHFHRYYSTLWRGRIPRLVAKRAQEEWVERHTPPEGRKVCARCGRKKPAHPLFFSKNTSADGYYSICKECRSRR